LKSTDGRPNIELGYDLPQQERQLRTDERPRKGRIEVRTRFARFYVRYFFVHMMLWSILSLFGLFAPTIYTAWAPTLIPVWETFGFVLCTGFFFVYIPVARLPKLLFGLPVYFVLVTVVLSTAPSWLYDVFLPSEVLIKPRYLVMALFYFAGGLLVAAWIVVSVSRPRGTPAV